MLMMYELSCLYTVSVFVLFVVIMTRSQMTSSRSTTRSSTMDARSGRGKSRDIAMYAGHTGSHVIRSARSKAVLFAWPE